MTKDFMASFLILKIEMILCNCNQHFRIQNVFADFVTNTKPSTQVARLQLPCSRQADIGINLVPRFFALVEAKTLVEKKPPQERRAWERCCIRMRSHRLLWLNDNKSAASFQQARLEASRLSRLFIRKLVES